MSGRRKKDVLNETWTKDELTRSLKKSSDKKPSHRGDKYGRHDALIEDEKYAKKERRRDERTRPEQEIRHKSRSDRHRESSSHRRPIEREEDRHHRKDYRSENDRDRTERRDRERHGTDKKERRSERERDDDKYYTVNGDDRKHRREKHDRDYEKEDHRQRKSDRRHHEEDEDERKHRRKDKARNEGRSSGTKRSEEDDRVRKHRDEKDDTRRSHRDRRDRIRDDDDEYEHRRRDRDHKRKDGDESDEHRREERKERKQREREDYEQRKMRSNDKENRHERRKEDRKHSRSGKYRHHELDEDKDSGEEETSSPRESKLNSTYNVEKNSSQKMSDAQDEYNYEDEDFEDYDDDFEAEEEESEQKSSEPKRNEVNRKPNEMDEIMKAIAAENERANSAQSSSKFGSTVTSDHIESPFSGRASSNSDSQERQSSDSVMRSTPVINFMAAKGRTSSHKSKKRVLKRSRDLKKLIQLDIASFDLIDMPPVTEYNLYIKNFGNSNTNQMSTQCKDDNLDQEIQTEVPELQDKWSQHPPHDIRSCGSTEQGDLTDEGQKEERERMLVMMRGDSKRLGHFLSRACKLVESLIIEGDLWEKSQVDAHHKSQLSFCDNFVGLQTNLAYLQGRAVVHVECSPASDVNLVAVAFAPASTSYSTRIDRKGIIAIWDARKPAIPEKVLICDACPTCCCFSPARSTFLFVGTDDGCVLAYDLRESGSRHHNVSLEKKQETVLRSPTYSTGCMSNGHSSPIVSITPVAAEARVIHEEGNMLGEQDNKQGHSGLAFQLASLEEAAQLCIWIVVELPMESNHDTDLGVAPMGRIKLLKSLSYPVASPVKSPGLFFRATCVKFSITDPNYFYVGTDTGHVVCCTQILASSQKHHSFESSRHSFTLFNELDSISAVTSIDVNPFQCFGASLILAGYDDGSLRLYLSDRELPVLTWPFSTEGSEVVKVQWSMSRPSVFFVLDGRARLHIWDAAILNTSPIKTENVDKKKGMICHFCLSSTTSKRAPEITLVYSAESNITEPSLVEVHKLAPHFSQITDSNEMEQLTAFLQSML